MNIDIINVLISCVGLFTTFGGAYLGAKIAGGNANKLYEKQKEDKQKDDSYRFETITCMEISKILDSHDKLFYYSIHCENLKNFENEDGTLNIKNVLDIYGLPLIELLKKEDVYKIDKEQLKEMFDILNNCNRYYNAFNPLDLDEIDKSRNKVILNTDNRFGISAPESDQLLEITHEMQKEEHNYSSKHIVCRFIHKMMDIKLKLLIDKNKNQEITDLIFKTKLPSKESEGFTNMYNF